MDILKLAQTLFSRIKNCSSYSLCLAISFCPQHANSQELPLGLPGGYNAFILSDFSAEATDIHGKLAAGGNVSLVSYGVATQIETAPDEYTLLAGGDIFYQNGQVFTGSILSSGDTSNIGAEIRNSLEDGASIDSGPLPFNIDDQFLTLSQISLFLSQSPSNTSVEYKWGGVYMSGDCESDTQVFALDGDIVKSSYSFNIDCVPPDATLIFNISGMNPGFVTIGLTHLAPWSSKTLFNFYEAETVTFTHVGIEGTVLAPQADIVDPKGHMNGSVYAKSWSGSMELHHVPFIGDLSVIANHSPEIVSEPQIHTNEGQPYTYDVEAIDEDLSIGDVLSFSLDKAPDFAHIDSETGIIEWLPGSEFVASVAEYNDQCYIVPAGSVGVLQDEVIGSEPTYIAPLFQDVKAALELAGDYTATTAYSWHQTNQCLGCHVQTQSLVGLETSMSKADVDEEITEFFLQEFLNNQQADGSIRKSHPEYSKTQTSLAIWALENHPERERTAAVRVEALRFFQERQQVNGDALYWTRDHDTAWLEIPEAINALLAQGVAGLLRDVEVGEIGFSSEELVIAEAYRNQVDAMAAHFLASANTNPLNYAFKLIGLSELLPFIQSPTLKAQSSEAIHDSDAILRELQKDDGGWPFYTWQESSDPLITAWVGIALDYGNPAITDPVVLNTIQYLLDTQQANGVWRTSTGWFTTNFGTTSLVMAYLPIALDHLGNPDLRVGEITLMENADSSISLSVEVSNRGITDVNESTMLEIYSGIDSSGALIGSAVIPSLASGDLSTISFTLSSDRALEGAVFARIVGAHELDECDIKNNSNVAAVFKARVTDRRGLFDTQIYALNVIDVNSPPEFSGETLLELEGAQVLRSTVAATDSDRGDALAFRLIGAPEGLYIDERTGQFVSDPELLSPGNYTFVVSVTDLRGATSEREISLTVNENLAPSIVSEPVQQGIEKSGYLYDVDAVDPNGDELGYSLDRVFEPSLVIDRATGEITSSTDIFVESLRSNNSFCSTTAGELGGVAPALKWHWTASGNELSSYSQVMHMPIAVPLFDTNQNGKIDGNDEVAIVFSTYNGGNYEGSGVLRAVSATTGETLWTNTEVQVKGAAGLAAADIDGDGFVEIITGVPGQQNGGVYAFEHDGTFKWASESLPVMRWGSVSIADLEGDGIVDIVAGNVVINPDGSTKWQGNGVTGANGVGPLSIVADVDLDGTQEVIAGSTIYRSDGSLFREGEDGFSAVGNFDADDYPEIVRVFNGTVYLHDDNGDELWRYTFSGGGRGGAPTIADMNGDGKLNIGVAGAAFYSVINSDGSLLWEVPTVDTSSNVTGSSVFDFNGDGKAEVVYADQNSLRIYNGANGLVVYDITNPSGTTYEYPLIVDVDGDQHAEIVVVSNNLINSGVNGVRVFESSNDDWAPTRKIWNQHSYHITNINDYGSVPLIEQPSWLTHNTYRLNTFTDRSVLSLPDLALFELSYNDSTETLSAVLKNRGDAPALDTISVNFYTNGDRIDDTPLGEVSVQGIGSLEEKTITLAGVEANQLASYVYATIVTDVNECDTSNNSQGSTVLQVGAYDPLGLFDSQTFLYSTINVNDAPQIISSASSGAASSLNYSFQAQVADVDLGDSHRFSLQENPAQLSINAVTGVITAEAETLAPGVYNFYIAVEDSTGLKDEQLHTLTVAVPDNLPPQFETKVSETIPALQDWLFTANATDPDGDSIQYGLAARPPGMQIDGATGELYWVPTRDQLGLHIVDVVAVDERGESAHLRFSLTVTDPYVSNHPPQITSTPSGAVIVGKQFNYAVEAVDEDGDTLNYALEGESGDMAISPTGVFSWLPDASMVGRTYTVSVVVSDGRGGSASQNLALPVNDSFNNPPQITSDPSQSATVGALYEYQVIATDIDGDDVAISIGTKPNGMSLQSGGLVVWVPAEEQNTQLFEVEIIATDSRGAKSVQSFPVSVNLPVMPNELPYFTSVPSSPAIIGLEYQYQATAIDPDNDALVYTLVSPDLAEASLSPSGLFTWTPSSGTEGNYVVAIQVSDGKATVTQSYELAVERNPTDTGSGINNYPVITSQPISEIVAGGNYSYQVEATDPDGDVLVFELLSTSAEQASMTPDGLLSWSPTEAEEGIQDFRVQVSDGQLSTVQFWSVRVWDEYPPLRLFLDVYPVTANAGETVTLTVATTGGSGQVAEQIFIDGQEITLDEFGSASFSSELFGVYDVLAIATDSEQSLEMTDQFIVLDPSDTTPPVAILESPDDTVDITTLTSIVGSVTDDNLEKYELFISPKDAGQWSKIATGTSEIDSGEIAEFDPTMRANGIYDLVLVATDSNGQTDQDNTTLIVDSELKVGNFSVSFVDLHLEMEGIPITVTRTYDSRRKNEDLDFGYGWTVDYQSVRVQESRVLGSSWSNNYYREGFFGNWCMEPTGDPKITISLPDGSLEKFRAKASPDCAPLVASAYAQLVFEPLAGTQSTLEQTDYGQLRLVNGNLVDPGDVDNFNGANPNSYLLTTRHGYKYYLNQSFGIRKVETPTGESITYSENGIAHSSGKAITFERDSFGRITDIIDPKGNRIKYAYEYGDLKSVKTQEMLDAASPGSTYTYAGKLCDIPANATPDCHLLDEIYDALGRKVVKNLYDESGRLYAQEDGDGNTKYFDHDLSANTSIVNDLDGRQTIYSYDDKGFVETEIKTITDGTYDEDIVTTYTYDQFGNEETKTVGSAEYTWQKKFNTSEDLLYSIDPESNRVDYLSYNARGQETLIQDEMGRLTSMEYDILSGNLEKVTLPEVTDPDSGITTQPQAENIYNLVGQLDTTVDLRGMSTTYRYYPRSHEWSGMLKTKSTEASGTITYTYDENNNVATETRERTVEGVVVEETISYEYDSQNRLTVTTYPDDSYTETQYDLTGNTDRERDRFGVWTEYDYDAYGRLRETRYPDETTEIREYTLEGLLKSVKDRSGHTTRYEYNDAGLQWKVHFEDGTYTETQYTPQGWVKYQWDEKRNLTEYDYDLAGKRKAVIRHYTDAAGNPQQQRHSFTYYDNGELHTETDANNHTITYVINALDQRIETQFENGTSAQTRYDAMGARIRGIDQNTRATDYRHDDLGRLKEVQPDVYIEGERVPITSYTYDEVGNKLTQTDANNHTTRWTYDYFGRVLTRTLPEQMTESFVYDDEARTQTHTDFNGQVSVTQFNKLGQIETVSHDNGASESYIYWPNGQIRQVTDKNGVTEYGYDNRDRLDYEVQPDGTRLDYDYDDVGNRTLVEITRDDVVVSSTSYTYDALNRLETVTDVNGTTRYTYDAVGNLDTVTYPNNIVEDYDYNTVNQLTLLTVRDAVGNVIGSYTYELDDTGRRDSITEASGRFTDYIYDDLYRLTDEIITDSAAGNHTATYQYDWVGNRTYETVNGVETLYRYDDNDRLEQQGGTVYGYDDNGNLKTETLDGSTTTYHYDERDKLIQVDVAEATIEYTYNHSGIRTSKIQGGINTQYIVDSNRDYAQVLQEIINGEIQAQYTYGHDLISQVREETPSFYIYDGLGSTRALSDSTGAISDTYDYEAFGELLNQTGATENDYLFTGEQFDRSLDQYYLRARYYDQGVGRFTQMDTWGGINNQPVTLNKYLYAHADPVLNTDPSGHFIGSLTTAQSIGAILAATAVVTYQVGQVAATGGTWGDGIYLGPSSTGWLILAVMVGTNSSLLTNIADKVNEDDTSTYTLYHGTDIVTARLLAGGSPIDIDGAGCNWSVSCGSFYLADQLGDAEHFAVFTQSGVRDGGVVQYNFSAAAYQTIKGIATIQPLQSAPFFNPMGNEIIVPPSGFSVFNALMLKGDIEPGPVR